MQHMYMCVYVCLIGWEGLTVHVDDVAFMCVFECMWQLGDIYCICCQLILGDLFGSCMICVCVCVLDGYHSALWHSVFHRVHQSFTDRERENLVWSVFPLLTLQ